MFTIGTALFISLSAWSIDYRFNPVYLQIIKNKPSISKEKAVKLTKAIQLNSYRYGLPKHTFTAILMQESSYRLSAKNCKAGVCADYGIGQIYHKTVTHFGMDVKRLTTDLEYSVEAAAIILADFDRMYGHKESDYWTRYNTSKPSLRKLYKERVKRWL